MKEAYLKRLPSVCFQLYDFPEKAKLEIVKKWLQRVEEEMMNKVDTEKFQGSENTLYDTIMVDTYHYRFVKPNEYIA